MASLRPIVPPEEGESALDNDVFWADPISDVCFWCRHLNQDALLKCDAFDKIPPEIWRGDNKHITEYPGDKGIRFEPIEEYYTIGPGVKTNP